eukprot:1152084-Pelagomonas_calceolata.AAC.1
MGNLSGMDAILPRKKTRASTHLPMQEPEKSNCAALLAFVSLLWATEAIPLFATALLVPPLAAVLRVLVSSLLRVPTPCAFVSFFDSSSSQWAAVHAFIAKTLVGANLVLCVSCLCGSRVFRKRISFRGCALEGELVKQSWSKRGAAHPSKPQGAAQLGTIPFSSLVLAHLCVLLFAYPRVPHGAKQVDTSHPNHPERMSAPDAANAIFHAMFSQ